MRHVTLSVCIVLLCVNAVHAEPADSAGVGDLERQVPPRADRFWALAQLEVPGRYYYRGFVQERRGLIVQPAVRMGLDFWRPEHDAVDRVAVLVGVRDSFHSKQTGAQPPGPSVWYEADLFGGVQTELFGRFQAELLYAAIAFPNNARDTIEEINLNLAYNDSGLWAGPHDFAVNPFLSFKHEIGNSGAPGGPQGTLMQLGAEPGFVPVPGEQGLPLRISFPFELGVSLNDYYVSSPQWGFPDNETVGYWMAGVSLTVPLWFIPPDRGQWAVSVGVDYIRLGSNLRTFYQATQQAQRRDDFIPRITIGARF